MYKSLHKENLGVININIKVNNLNINYLKMGEGKTVLILPGWGTTINVYKKYDGFYIHIRKCNMLRYAWIWRVRASKRAMESR